MLFHTLRFIWRHPLASQARIDAFSRWTRWQLGSRLIRQPIICNWIGSTKLVMETGMTGATGNFYCGLHEYADMAFVLHFLREDDGFADVGANIGSYTILASGVSGAKTRAFEPHPETFKRLQRNLVVNDLNERAIAKQMAVGRESGVLRFTADRDTMNQVVDSEYGGETIDVPSCPLDTALNGFDAILWKIDVEGFEDEVLWGARRALKCPSLRAILLETVSERSASLLEEHGFEELGYDPRERQLVEARGHSHNSLWIRDLRFCQDRLSSAPDFEVFGLRF